VDVENVLGSGAFEEADVAETSVYLTQPLELWGLRASRGRLGALEAELAETEASLLRGWLRAEVRAAFAGLLAAQERLAVAEDLVDGLEAIAQRDPAGRAGRALEAARTDVARQTLGLRSARLRLALASGIASEALPRAEGDLAAVEPPPPLEPLLDAKHAGDTAAVWDARLEVRQAALEHQRARRAPEVALSAGYRHFSDTDDGAAIFYLSLPLPLFDRNQGELEAAGRELSEARLRRRSAELRWQAQVLDAHEELASAFAALEALAAEPPAGETPSDRISIGERVDRLSDRAGLRRERIDALERVHRARAALDGLTGLAD